MSIVWSRHSLKSSLGLCLFCCRSLNLHRSLWRLLKMFHGCFCAQMLPVVSLPDRAVRQQVNCLSFGCSQGVSLAILKNISNDKRTLYDHCVPSEYFSAELHWRWLHIRLLPNSFCCILSSKCRLRLRGLWLLFKQGRLGLCFILNGQFPYVLIHSNGCEIFKKSDERCRARVPKPLLEGQLSCKVKFQPELNPLEPERSSWEIWWKVKSAALDRTGQVVPTKRHKQTVPWNAYIICNIFCPKWMCKYF